MKPFRILAITALATAIVVSASLAQGPSTLPGVPKASGPMGPRPAGRSAWRVPTLVELNGFLNWRVGVPASAFQGLTLSEAMVRVDKLALGYIEGSNTQWVSPEIRKNLDYNLAPAEVTAVKNRLRRFQLTMAAYHVDTLGPDDATRRKVFEFARSLGVDTIVSAPKAADLPAIDKLASEFGINVAVGPGLLPALEGRSKRIGISSEGFRAAGKDRLMAVSLGPLGYDSAGARKLLEQMYRSGIKPMYFSLHTADTADPTADLSHTVDGFEQAVLPVLGAFMVDRSKMLPIRGPSELSLEVRQQIEAAIPHTALAKPPKPRKLLVMDEHMSHSPIPNTNYALEVMGKATGAFEAVFSNDLDNLKGDKIRQFDAVMLNSSEADVSADPAIRDGLLRFVREGGGLGGIHAASWSFAFWPEFMEMTGASQGPHKVQTAMLKIDDPDSPITKSFGGQDFATTDEFYRMTDTGLQGTYYSRDKVHVLLSVDLAKTPDFNEGRAPFIRQDNDYAVAWIKGYGKGRVFFTCLGHTPQMFADPKIESFLFAAMQFILGDLAADTTPSAELSVK